LQDSEWASIAMDPDPLPSSPHNPVDHPELLASSEWEHIAIPTTDLPEPLCIAAAPVEPIPPDVSAVVEAQAALVQPIPPDVSAVALPALTKMIQKRLFDTALFVCTHAIMKASQMPSDASSSAATAASAAVAAPLAILDEVANAAPDPDPAVGMELAVVRSHVRPSLRSLFLAIVPSTTSNCTDMVAWKSILDLSAKTTSDAAHEFVVAMDLYPQGFTFDSKALDICAFDRNSPNGSLNSGTAMVQSHQLGVQRKKLRRIRQLLCSYTLRLHYWWITPFIYLHTCPTN
jgi:hypothetical protein